MENERVRGQLERVLKSAAFADAERASHFLRFVVERTLEGRTEEIKESVIGVEVLRRSPSFDPKTDPIVRVEAGRLRARLHAYYEGEGKDEPVLIALPKGRYVPEFSDRVATSPRREVWRPPMLVVAGAVLGFLVALVVLPFYRRTEDAGETMQLAVLPPPGAFIEHAAISPDGRRIAFTAVKEGKPQLWVRSLDAAEAKPLPGTDDAAYPFWAPDNRSLGFVVRTTLKRIEISGGPAEALCSVGPFRGGTWSHAGAVVYAPHPLGVLYEIAAKGGASKAVTVLDPTRGEVSHAFPQFLPDGRHFLYFAVSSRPGESSIRVGSLDSTESKVLVNAEASAAYAPPSGGKQGFLLFVYGGALLAQEFNPKTLDLSGERRTVVPRIRYRSGHADFSVSQDGVLAYRAGSNDNRQLAWFDREGRLLETVGSPNDYYSWSLSPDEKRIAALELDPSGAGSSIWILELATGASSLLTSGSGVVFNPVWSADSSQILFSTGTEQAMSLQRQAVNTRSPTDVLESEGPKFLSDWSADGRFATYFTPWPDWQKLNLFVVDLKRPAARDNPRRPWLTDSSEASGYFSPSTTSDGPRWIAYTSRETGRDEVYVRSFPGGDQKWLVSTAGGWQAHWRRDGHELFYVTLDGTLMDVDVSGGATFQGRSPHPLFRTSVPPWAGPPEIPTSAYAVSKDGQRFLINGAAEGASTSLTIQTHWQAGLR